MAKRTRVHVSLPDISGIQLWLVMATGSYVSYDYGGGSDRIPFTSRVFVIAKNCAEAESKAEHTIAAACRNIGLRRSEVEITSRPFPLGNLCAARNSSNDGRMGYHSTSQIQAVVLHNPEDRKRYRLAVCLIEDPE